MQLQIASRRLLQIASRRLFYWLRQRVLRKVTDRSPWARRVLGERALLARYRRFFGRDLPMEHPITFSEKLFVAMIENNRQCDPVLTQLVDKLRARQYVEQRIGAKYLVKLLWHGTRPENIPFGALPADYVAKTNHASGTNIMVKGDGDPSKIVRQLNIWLSENYYFRLREAQYRSVVPEVMIEEYIGLDSTSGLVTLRCWCFDGKVEMIQPDDGARNIMSFYDPAWNVLNLQYRATAKHRDFERPEVLSEVKRLAEALAEGIAFVRVDLYLVGTAIYFNEMTFTPCAGQLRFSPPDWDAVLGEKWRMKPDVGKLS